VKHSKDLPRPAIGGSSDFGVQGKDNYLPTTGHLMYTHG
jgi:hypothetical protein